MKIAVLANDTTFVHHHRKEIIERLVNDGHAVEVYCEFQKLRDELEALGCTLVEVNTGRHGKNPLSDVKLAMTYVRLLKKRRPDAVLTFNIKPNVYGGMACACLGIPYITNVTGLGTAVEYKGKLQWLTIRLYRAGVAKAACIFFQNEENLEFFKSRGMIGADSRVRLLPGSGVNLEDNPALDFPDDGRVRFLLAARIMKEKGIDLFLAVAGKYHSESVEFHICGMCDDERYNAILAQEQQNGVVIYHGERKDMRRFYGMCSCLLQPSYYPEGMSNVLLEAAACARPIITADRSGCRETVVDGVSGYIVPVRDEEATLDAVGRFLSLSHEEQRNMGLAGRRHVEDHFDRRLVVQAYLEELGSL